MITKPCKINVILATQLTIYIFSSLYKFTQWSIGKYERVVYLHYTVYIFESCLCTWNTSLCDRRAMPVFFYLDEFPIEYIWSLNHGNGKRLLRKINRYMQTTNIFQFIARNVNSDALNEITTNSNVSIRWKILSFIDWLWLFDESQEHAMKAFILVSFRMKLGLYFCL